MSCNAKYLNRINSKNDRIEFNTTLQNNFKYIEYCGRLCDTVVHNIPINENISICVFLI